MFALLLIWVITVAKTEENITNLKEITGILNIVIKIQDYRPPNKLMQCFHCQRFCRKVEFSNIICAFYKLYLLVVTNLKALRIVLLSENK